MNGQVDSLIVTEDGSLELGNNIENIIFHQDLNVFLITTKDNSIRVFDPHSSLKLADVSLAKYVPDPGGKIQCMYHGETGGLISCGGKNLGIRHDHQGVLLLHTILQTQVASHEDTVTLDILLSEAIQLQQVFWEVNNIENASEVKEALAQAVNEPLLGPSSNSKIGKWRTVCLTMSVGTLRSACASLVSQLRHLAYFIPALSLASALYHRLNHLSPAVVTDVMEIDKESMFSEADRLATFSNWPHMNYKWALPDQMAQAGFFHQLFANDEDRAMCFICNVCLVYWEPTDEPWSEHERHSPNCPYVKGEYTHNVPLSITHATGPAVPHSERSESIHRISVSNSKLFLASATAHGSIVVWNIAKQLKKEITFMIDPSDSTILDKHFSDTIGYTDIPLQLHSPPRDVWEVPSSSTSERENQDSSGPTAPSSSSSSKLMQKLYPSVPQDASSDPLSSLVSLYEEPDVDYSSGKEYLEAQDSLSHLINISDFIDSYSSPTEVDVKSGNEGALEPPETQSMSPVDEMNYIQCIELSDVLPIDNFGHISDPVSLVDSPVKTDLTDAAPKMGGSGVPSAPPQMPCDKLEFPIEDISDELFAPPRPSHDVRVSSLCVFTDPASLEPPCGSSAENRSLSGHRVCLVVGVGLRRYDLFGSSASEGLVQALNDANQATSKETKPPLDIMKLEKLAEVRPDPDGDLSSETSPSSSTVSSSGSSSAASSRKIVNARNSSSPKNFVPYLLVYDLSLLAQSHVIAPKQNGASVPQGTSKKSTRKVVPTNYSLVKVMKGELSSDFIYNYSSNEGKLNNMKGIPSGVPREGLTPLKKVPKCAQCIPLPHKLHKLKLQLFVDLILISPCGQYLLVSLQQLQKDGKETHPLQDESSPTCGPFPEDRSVVTGGFILYRICNSDESLFVQEDPVSTNLFSQSGLVAKEIIMIPTLDSDTILGSLAAVVCLDGALRILSLTLLEYIQEIVPQDKKFNSITYCHSLERLCVTKEDGKVVLFQVRGDEDPSDDPGASSNLATVPHSAAHGARVEATTVDREMDLQSAELLVNKNLNEETLDKCLELTQFQSGCPRFVATVPPCWEKVIQAQKKRRNPQHLQHQSEKMDTAMTWRLESERSTVDEHMLDILLPLSGSPGAGGVPQIGHIDVKLNFISGVVHPLPKIQITLLKQNLKTRKSVCTKILDDHLDFPGNPVVTREFLMAHKAEILCGPVTVNQFVDLTGQAANLTLTSRDLLACKARNFLIHIKAIKLKENEDEEEPEPASGLDLLPQYVPPQSTTFFDKLSSSSANIRRGDAPKGCNVIQDLTLTIHCCAKSNIPHERLQRLAMIERGSFHSELIAAIVNPTSTLHIQHRALDILLWILCIHTASEHRSGQRKELLSRLQGSVTSFVQTCLLVGDRSLAHKMTKIILTALESVSTSEARLSFGEAVLSALLESLDALPQCRSAGAVYWFFSLLNHVKWCNPAATADKVTEMLGVMSEVLSQKMDPLHALLQTTFGLYGVPFERHVFDTFPPLLMKQLTPVSQNLQKHNGSNHQNQNHHTTTTTNGNNNLLSSHQGNGSWNKYDCPNLLWAGSNPNLKSPLGCADNSELEIILGQNGVTLGLTPQIGGLCGLFEVEPLHFTLHMASDGTKIERVYPGSGYSTGAYVIQPTSNTETDSSISHDSSKTPSVSMPPPQLHKAVEDMKHMVMKDQAVALLLSKKAKKSYLEKLKGAAKQKAQKIMKLNTTALASSFQGMDPSAGSKPLKAPQTDSNSSSILSSDPSPDGAPPPSVGLISPKLPLLHNEAVEDVTEDFLGDPLMNPSSTVLEGVNPDSPLPPASSHGVGPIQEGLPDTKGAEDPPPMLTEIVANISEGVANSLFGTSGLNSSLNLLSNAPSDVSTHPAGQDAPPMDVIDIFSDADEPRSTSQNEPDDLSLASSQSGLLCLKEVCKALRSNWTPLETISEQAMEKIKIEKCLEDLSIPPTCPASDGATTFPPKESQNAKSSALPTSGVPYQQLLSTPPQQMIVIEQMHSGARRFVILDFGAPVVLTDVIIPACSDLVSLTIDIWLKGEEMDGERLAVASDIGFRPLVLADLQPPPLCRFLKVTALGRYGMSNSQCRIPVGAFYGHTIILPWDLQPSQQHITVTTKKVAKMQLAILNNMVEDVSCRYSLACSKLKALVQPHWKASTGGGTPLLSASAQSGTGNASANAAQEKKIMISYQECLTEQQQLNLILAVIRRLQKFIGLSSGVDSRRRRSFHGSPFVAPGVCTTDAPGSLVDYRKELEACSADQLSTLVQALLNCLLTLAFPPPTNDVQIQLLSWCGPTQAKALIENVCIRGPKGAQVAVVSLLARLCTNQAWWGQFLASTLVSLFTTGESSNFPATRIFALLTFLGQKSVQCGRGTHVIDAVVQSLLTELQKGSLTHLGNDDARSSEQAWFFGSSQGQVDPRLISWLLLFLSLCLDLVVLPKNTEGEKSKDGGRWSWLTAESSLQKKGSDVTKGTPRASRELLRRRLVHHKQQLVNLETASKSFGEVLAGLENVINPKMFKQSEQVFKKIQKQHAMKHYKDLCSIQRNETSSLRKLSRNSVGATCAGTNADNKSTKEEGSSRTRDGILPVDRVRCLSVAKALINLLTNTQFPCSVDTFLLACKVIGGLGKLTRPSLKVSEFLDEEHLGTLLTDCMTLDSMWGSPWAVHALTCLLQDILEGESSYGMIVLNVVPSPARQKTPDTNATDNNKEGRAFPVVLGDDDRGEAAGQRCLAPQDLGGAQVESPSRNKVHPPAEESASFVPTSPTPFNSMAGEDLSSQPVSSSLGGESTDSSTADDPLTLANDVEGGPLTGGGGPSSSASAATQPASFHEPSSDDTPAVAGTQDLGLGAEEEETPAETSTSSAVAAVTSASEADQSATAASLPIVNVATSHFAPIEEEEGPLYFRLCWESDESSPSDDMIEFFSEVQTHLNSLPVSSSGLKYLPQLLPNSIYSPTTPLKKETGRVGELLTAPLASYKAKMGPDHSTAVDARLENGLALAAEHRIHMMNAIHASRLCAAVSAPLQVSPNTWDDNEMYRGGNMKPSIDLISLVFQGTLSEMSLKFEGNQLESILELWLNLNLDLAGEEYNSLISPAIPLHPQTISALLSAVARSQNVSIRCWCLVLQTLTLCSNLNPPLNSPDEGTPLVFSAETVNSFDPSWMSTSIISDRNFIPVLQKLLSGHYMGGMLTRCDVVGNTLTNLLEDLLVRLEVRCDVISPESTAGNALKFSLLKLVMRLLEPDASLARGLGPLDVQKTLLTIVLSMHYNGLHKTHIAVAIVSAVANVVNGFLSSDQDVAPGSSSEPNSSVLGGLFASVLGADGQQEPVPTRRTILCALVNLAKKLVELPREPPPKANASTPAAGAVVQNSRSGGEGDPSYYQRCLTDSLKLEQKQQLGLTSGHASQTDEHKAMNPPPGEESPGASNPVLGAAITNDSIATAIRSRSPIGAQPCFHNLPDKTVYVADNVLQDGETMQLLIHSLRWCEGSASVPLNLIGVVSGDVSETLGIGKTLADALYQLLVTLNQKATNNDLLLEAIFRYVIPSYRQTVFSEGLFCFYTQVLNCETMLRKFSATNGTELIWDNLVKSVGAFGGPRTGLISSVMNHLSPPLPPSTVSSTSHRRIDPSTGNLCTMESGNPQGLFNFAPLAAVTSSNPTARPADALVKSTHFFQRAKSPLWSYHFSPEENWVDLNLTLPCPILLHEVQLQPHTMPLGICPSGISLETGIEGGCLIPVTSMLCTAGLSCINVSLRNPVVASVIVVRLHRPRDQSTLGLSHLKLFGTTTFKNKVPPRDATWEQGPHKSSYWWLRLVDHCMFDVPGGFDIMMESGLRVQGVIEAMVALLATSCAQPNIAPSTAPVDILGDAVTRSNCELINTLASTLLSNTTFALVSFNQEMLHRLVKCLFNHPIMLQPMGSSSSVDAAVALLCRISISREGATLLVEWFTRMLEETPGGGVGHSSREDEEEEEESERAHRVSVNPEILHCFAAILWNANDDDVATLITDSLFRKVYTWCERTSGAIKEGLDYIICSLCKVRPHFFTHLLLYMGFLTVIDCSSTSITDDRKDREAEIRASYTDDMKGSQDGCPPPGPESRLILQDPSVISIAQHHLQTISLAAQSPSAIRLMLESGFPLLLVHGILEWCKAELLRQVESCASPSARESATDHEKASGPHGSTSPGASDDGPTPPPSAVPHDALPPFSTDLVVDTLETLAALCAEGPMKDWLGLGEGSVFWIPILTVLGDPVMHGSEMSMRVGGDPSYGDYSRVEDATIALIREVCCNHDQNQKFLAATLCHLIERQNAPPPGGLTYLHSLSGFTRRLVLQILLETENVLVQVTSKFCLSQPPLHTTPPNSGHPRFGAGNKTRLMHLPVTTRVDEVVKMVTDWWQQGVTQPPLGSTGDSKQNQDFENGLSFKKEIREVGLELVDKLSVAAGVTAKEKRMRDKGQNKGTTTKNRKRESSSQSKKNSTEEIAFGGTSPVLTHGLTHDELLGGGSVLPGTLTLSQVLAALGHHRPADPSQLKFNLVFTKDACQVFPDQHIQSLQPRDPNIPLARNVWWPLPLQKQYYPVPSGLPTIVVLIIMRVSLIESVDSFAVQSLLKTEPRPSMLSVFSSQGGLSVLAQHMALLYPDTSHHYITSLPPKMTADDKEKSLEDESGLYIDMNYSTLPDCLTGNSLSNSPGFVRNAPAGLFGAMPIPPHALGAFTLFLRLPGYAEMLLTDNVKACCLLRSALGVYDNIYEGENSSSFVGSLATLPFQVLEVLLKSTPLTTDDGLMLRKMCLKTGVLHLILACLSALSHQDSPEVITSLQHPNVPIGLVVATARASCPSQRQGSSTTRNDNERCHYWAKGTGFGTGSTNQSWNVEQALIKQKLEEQHVVWLIKLLAQYINPGDNLGEDLQQLCQEEVDKVLSSTIQDAAASRERSNSLSNSYSFASTACSSQCQVPQTAPTQDDSGPTLPLEIFDLFVKAGLVSKISSYLSNDSVLDMSRHVPLYQALMALVRAIAVTPSLSTLFLSPGPVVTTTAQETTPASDVDSPGSPNLPALLTKMKSTVNTYMTKLKWKSDKVPASNLKSRKAAPGGAASTSTFNGDEKPLEMSVLQSMPEELENEDQGLSLLVPDIQLSTKVVEIVMERLYHKEADERRAKENRSDHEPEAHLSQLDVYLKAMKPLQFDSYEMIVEDAERGIRFVVPYHYEGLVRDAGETYNPRRMKRLAQEAVTLSMSLPLSYSSSVFVRTDVDRLDVMKVLITGPEDTPYANGCFEFDVYFSNNYPSSPLYINLQTTGEKRVRFNPNLYQDGKVCLSILNTWHGRPEEKWNPQTSSLLQVLVSIQSLILVSDPYFNEPGYERSRGSQAALHNSQEYDANIRVATIRWAILNQLRNPSPCFKEVIDRHFWLKRKDILTQVESWITELESLSENKRVGRMIPHHAVKMKKLYQWLSEDFSKMVAPKGLEYVTVAHRPAPPVTAQAARLSSDDEEAAEEGTPVSRRIRKPSKAKVPPVSAPEVSCSMSVPSNSSYFYVDKSTSFPSDGGSTTLMDAAATNLGPSSQASSGGDSNPVDSAASSQHSKVSLVHPVAKSVNCVSSVQEETAEPPMASSFHIGAPHHPSYDVKDEFSLFPNNDNPNQT